ncbi:MAG TPA: glycoside hydrolase family 97 C-terminal domain-containing protein [Methylomirabilota bacterium]|nr:glycoside hydrolase family 97 C-terminal domain-containing protein [Methylomirabilota bacterium]
MWDATLVLPDSEIGELAAYARRTGERWFVAAMCGPAPKTFDISLSFLGPGPHRLAIVRDGNTDASVDVENTTRDRSDLLRIELRAGGGFVAQITKE